MPPPPIDKPAQQTRDILNLLSANVERLASDWESTPNGDSVDTTSEDVGLPVSHAEYDAVKTILAALGSLESLVLNPHMRLSTLSMSYTTARALHIAAEHNIAELLAQHEDDGVPAAQLAKSTGIEEAKLCTL